VTPTKDSHESIGAVLTAIDDGVAVVTLNRPERLNALTPAMMDDLLRTFDALRAEPAVRVVILTGAGRGFCAGLDLGSEDPFGLETEVEAIYARQEKVASLALTLRALPQPVIAAVNGPASGGGLALALAADIRIAARSAIFNVAFVRIGLSGCDVGVSHLLPRIVGLGIASELMLTGRRVGADEAERIRLVNRTVEDDAVISTAFEVAAQISANSPFGVRMTKQVLNRNVDAGSLEAAIELENRTQVLATRTRGAREALSAFIEKRPPVFEPPPPPPGS
jgi:enoyl-CoA hydratase/carnithine racemase